MLALGGEGFGQITNSDLAKMKMDSTKIWKLEEFKRTAFDSIVEVKEIDNCLDKKVYFLGTHHVGTELYYQNIKSIIDSFHTNGFIIYFEGIRPDTTDKGFMYKRQIGIKYKKIMGRTYDKTKSYQELASLFKGLIGQPTIDSLGGKATDINADVSVRDVVEYFENKYGSVHDSIPKQNNYREIKNDIQQSFRNKYITTMVEESEHDKILIFFGSGHLLPLQKKFKTKCD